MFITNRLRFSTAISYFDWLNRNIVEQSMAVASEGGNPLVTGRYPLPSWCLNMNGTSHHIHCGGGSDIRVAGDMTTSIWINHDSRLDTDYFIACVDNGELETQNALYTMFINTDGTFSYVHEYGAGNNETFTSTTIIPTGVWTHMLLSRDTVAKTVSFYVNGVLDSTLNYTNNPTGGTTTSLILGGLDYALSLSFDGKISNFKLLNNKITAQEALDIYNGVSTLPTVRDIPLNQSTGTAVLSRDGNSGGILVNGEPWLVDNTMPRQADSFNNEGGSKYLSADGSNYLSVDMAGQHVYEWECDIYLPEDVTPTTTGYNLSTWDSDNSANFIGIGSVTTLIANEIFTIGSSIGNRRTAVVGGSIPKGLHTFKASWNGSTYDLYIDGVIQSVTHYAGGVALMPFQGMNIRKDYMHNLRLSDNSGLIHSYAGKGGEITDWTDLTGGKDFTTATGSPSTILIPPSTVIPTNDCLGNALDFSGSVYPIQPVPTDSYAVRGDGSTVYIPTGVFADSTTELEIHGRFLSLSSALKLHGNTSQPSSERFYFGVTDANDWILGYNGFITGSPADTNSHIFKLNSDGLYIDGELSIVASGSIALSTREIFLLAHNTSIINAHTDFDMSYAKVTKGGVVQFEYTCAEGVGATVHDISGSDNHGTLVNATTGSEGMGAWAGRISGHGTDSNRLNGFSRRAYFNGSAVTTYNDTDSVNQAKVTYSTWVVLPDVTSIGSQDIINDYDGAQIDSFFGLRSYGAIFWFYNGGVGSFHASTIINNFQSNTLHHVCAVFDSGTLKIYLDGVEQAVTVTGTPATTVAQRNNFSLGSRTGGSNSFTGVGADVSIFHDALTPSEIVALHAGGINSEITDVDLVHRWSNIDTWVNDVSGQPSVLTSAPALIRIPADSTNPTLDVYGEVLTNPSVANGHNGAETLDNCYEVTEDGQATAMTQNLSNFDAIEFDDSDISLRATAPINTVFRRDGSAVSKDRLITFHNALTGDSLLKATSYMGNDPRFLGLDDDAVFYLRKVELADGERLEDGVLTAINNFVVGCKADGNFDALDCTTILMGARTIAGILIPLKGASIHTNLNFVSGDYSRTAGLLSDSGKAVATDCLDTSLVVNDNHHITGMSTVVRSNFVILSYATPDIRMMLQHGNSSQGVLFFNSNSGFDSLAGATSAGLYGSVRSSSSGYTAYRPNVSSYFTRASQAHQGGAFSYALDDASRFDFHSIGRSLNYTLLNSRYATLKSEIATALT